MRLLVWYMHELGYPVEAAIYVTTAMPENFAWLTEADGKRVGISVEIPEELASPPPPSTQSTSSPVPAPAAPAVVPVADPVAPRQPQGLAIAPPSLYLVFSVRGGRR